MPASAQPRDLTVAYTKAGKTSPDQTIVLEDVLVGEVWLASGQSNMAYTINEMKGTDTDFLKDYSAIDNWQLLRFYNQPYGESSTPSVYSVSYTHLDVYKRQFLGSSFAFIAALQAVIGGDKANIPKALGGIIVAGAFYVVLALLIKLFGNRFMDKLFPPVVRGVGIAIIGLNLASAAINSIQANGVTTFTPAYYWSWGIALFVCLTAIILSSYGKGMVKMSSIVIALAAGYVVTLILVKTGLAPDSLMLSLIHISIW